MINSRAKGARGDSELLSKIQAAKKAIEDADVPFPPRMLYDPWEDKMYRVEKDGMTLVESDEDDQ